jgi:restriction system protein
MDKNYYMIRAMNSTQEDFDIFFKNNVVAVGWSDIDFSDFKAQKVDDLVDEVDKCYYASHDYFKPWVAKKLNEVRRFHEITDGDFIIIPFYNSIRFAVAKSERQYSDETYDRDLSNQRKVKYLYTGATLKTIPRDDLSEALQRRLRVRGSTVSNLFEFKQEIEKLFSIDAYSWTSDFEEKENTLKNQLQKVILHKIRNGKTNLKTGGIGMELLVQELFEIEGYKAEILGKATFKNGDADVYAVKSDKFQETRILVQVKHHSGNDDDYGLQQLIQIQKSNEYEDHKYVFITSANISAELRRQAEEFDIVAIDGCEFSEWIIENISKLRPVTKTKLGISSIPQYIEL